MTHQEFGFRCNEEFQFERRLMTPIMYAARDGHIQVVALLVASGAEVNTQDENGYTERDITLRQLLTMREDEFTKIVMMSELKLILQFQT
ncbi:hypothetical protein P7K49_025527 [Saguinus oedipus]|uniref:Uncharacterized protein n=1 Tax=Saguinus oedipus TaxID=9490 RepID=A0ABQ9UHF1_SAGOE|nr:hypothetical protein P7K49_025527 [Saguinus oedipus]